MSDSSSRSDDSISSASSCSQESDGEIRSPEIPPQRLPTPTPRKTIASASAQHRPSRSRKLPVKLRDAEAESFTEKMEPSRSVIVKCAQTGKDIEVKSGDLDPVGEEQLSKVHLTPGSALMLEEDGKPYPVQFVCYTDDRKSKKQKKKEQRSGKSEEPRKDDKGSQEKKCLSDKTNLTERRNVLVKAKRVDRESKKGRSAENEGGEPLPKRKRDDVYTALDEEDKDLILNLSERVGRMEKTLVKAMEMLESLSRCPSATVKQEEASSECTVNGVNILRLSARDAYGFGLQVLDILFTKEELAGSLLFSSRKSPKPGLAKDRVEKLLGFIERRYGNEWDMKMFVSKVNQKCRDTKIRDEL